MSTHAQLASDPAPAGVVLAQASLSAGESLPWLVVDGRALPLHEWAENWPLARVGSVTVLLEHWSEHETDLRALTTHPRIREVIASRGADIRSLRVQAPIRPRQTFCMIATTAARSWKPQQTAATAPTGPALRHGGRPHSNSNSWTAETGQASRTGA